MVDERRQSVTLCCTDVLAEERRNRLIDGRMAIHATANLPNSRKPIVPFHEEPLSGIGIDMKQAGGRPCNQRFNAHPQHVSDLAEKLPTVRGWLTRRMREQSIIHVGAFASSATGCNAIQHHSFRQGVPVGTSATYGRPIVCVNPHP